MKRYTENKAFECKIKECRADDWMKSIYGFYSDKNFCEYCPFMELVNRLAEFENKLEDDCK